MRRISLILLLATVIPVSVFLISHDNVRCGPPFAYRIGHIDGRFGIDEDEFRAVVEQSEAVWEASAGLNLFEYDPTATFTVNLVFDERQQATLDKRRLTRKLEQIEASRSNISKSYAHGYDTYQQKTAAYQELRDVYDRRLRAYNQAVTYWNQKGGAPPSLYQTLEKEKQDLTFLQTNLEAERTDINDLVRMLQTMQDDSKALVTTYQAHIQTYQSRYGGYTRFHQGEYNGRAITIYQFNDTADLILVLAHELGHALGLGHVKEPTAVMHELMGEQDLRALTLQPADVSALNTACGLD